MPLQNLLDLTGAYKALIVDGPTGRQVISALDGSVDKKIGSFIQTNNTVEATALQLPLLQTQILLL